MRHENFEIVERAIAAINERNIDAYLACCTDDVQLSTPVVEVSGVYEGHDGLRSFFADLDDTSPDFQLTIEHLQALGEDRVLALMRITGSGRASGIRWEEGIPTGNVYDLVEGKIKRTLVFLDREQALEAAGLRE
jgi:hypothetical protein